MSTAKTRPRSGVRIKKKTCKKMNQAYQEESKMAKDESMLSKELKGWEVTNLIHSDSKRKHARARQEQVAIFLLSLHMKHRFLISASIAVMISLIGCNSNPQTKDTKDIAHASISQEQEMYAIPDPDHGIHQSPINIMSNKTRTTLYIGVTSDL